ISAYDVLCDKKTVAAGPAVAVVGPELASTEAAIRLARAGCTVRLYVPGRFIAGDAHPGYREASHRLLAALRLEVLIDSAGADAETLRCADTLVVVHMPSKSDYEYPAAWTTRPNETQAYGGMPVSAFIADAYAPNLMTRGVYDAVDLAMSLGE